MINNEEVVVFICESDQEYMDIIRGAFQDSDTVYEIHSFCNPQELVQGLREAHDDFRNTPDIVVTSVSFENSDIDGAQLTTIAKALAEGVVVICINGVKRGSSITIEALKYGCDAWIRKDDSFKEELLYKAKHWTYYVKEKSKLHKLYNTVGERLVC